MNSLKRYLYTMIVLLLLAIVSGVVVWYLYQDLRPAALEERSIMETAPAPKADMVKKDTSPAKGTTSAPTISAASLTETQRAMLEAFGVDTKELVITEAVMQCARDGVGEERLTEITRGSAPTPYEAMKLLPCMKASE